MRALLRSVKVRQEAGDPPFLSETAQTLRESFPFDAAEALLFLERHGYLVVDRVNGIVGITREGSLAAAGDTAADLASDLSSQYGARGLDPDGRGPRGREVLDGRYRRFGVIGAGPLSSVSRAEVVSTRREVALKELREVFAFLGPDRRDDVVARFEQVVAEHARITHPNVVQIIDLNGAREFPYVVMELAHGGNLRRLLTRSKPLPAALVCAYLVQICHGLKTAHALDVVHRGVKPENVLLDVHGNAKLVDFGVASIVDRGAGRGGHVLVGMGSVGYMAPEQFRDPKQADARSDIYSLGILFYELCTGRLPGRRSPMPSQVRQDLPKGIDDVFDRMTQDDPDERYPLVEAILDDLYAVEGFADLLDRRGAVLMHRGPFSDLTLPLVTADAGHPDRADAGSVNLGASGEAMAGTSGLLHAAPGAGGRQLDGTEDLAIGESIDLVVGDSQVVSAELVQPQEDGARPVDLQPEPPPGQPPVPVMPRRRFGVPPRRK